MATHICRWSWLFSFLFRLQLPLASSIYSVNFASFLLSLPLLVRCLGAKIMKFFVQTALRRRLLQRLDNSPFQKKKFSRSVLYSLLSYFEIYIITMSSCWRLCFLLSFIGGWTLSIICFLLFTICLHTTTIYAHRGHVQWLGRRCANCLHLRFVAHLNSK